MAYTVVQKCPLVFLDWSDRASSTCNRDTYHCVADEKSKMVEVCTTPLWIEAGHCPLYNTVAKKIDSVVCSGNLCPKEVYRSDAVYKYHGCQLFASRTTSTSLESTTLTNISISSTIVGSVIPVLVVILLVVLWVLFRRKIREFVSQSCLCGREHINPTEETREADKLIEDGLDYAALEKNTPKELDVLNGFISGCEEYLEKNNMIAMFGKFGTGKRTLATQVAIRLAKKKPKSKIRIVGERDLISKDFELMQSTILIIHDPVKTCYTVSYAEEIINCLLKICQNAKKNKTYILVIFHRDDLDSLYKQFGEMKKAFKSTFQTVLRIYNEKQILSEIAKSNNAEISNEIIEKIQQGVSSVGEFVKLTLFLKNPEFQHEQFLSNPVMFIVRTLKTLEMSAEIHNQITFKLMLYVTIHGGEIAKRKLKDILHHAMFDDLRETRDAEKIIIWCLDKLLDLYVEESADGGSYRVLHDVITKSTFLAAFENYTTLLLKECDLILLFDCIRLKSRTEKVKNPGEIVYDYRNLKIAIPTEIFPTIARLSFERKEIIDVFKNVRLFEDEGLQMEWNKEHDLRLNKGHVKHTTVT